MRNGFTKSKKSLFITACLLSTLGSSLSNIALAYRFLLETSTGVEYSVVIYSALLSTIVFMPWSGYKIDSISNPSRLLMPLCFLSGFCQFLLGFVHSLSGVFVIIFMANIFSSLSQSITFKTLPCVLRNTELIQVNGTLLEISTFGFLFGPLAAPFVKMIFNNDLYLFELDAVSFFICGAIFSICFKNLNLLNNFAKKYKSKSIFLIEFVKSYKELITHYEIKPYILSFVFYMAAFTPMAYALALIAKSASNGIELYYSIPILSMFVGRMLTLKVIKNKVNENKLRLLYTIGLILSAILIFPLSFMSNLYCISLLEFFLGMAIAIASFSEKSFSQIICPKQNLAKLSTIKQVINVSVKFITVFFISYLVKSHQAMFISPLMAFFFMLAGIHLIYKYKFSTLIDNNLENHDSHETNYTREH